MAKSNFGVTQRRALTYSCRNKAFELLKKGFTEREILRLIPEYNGNLSKLKADLRQTLKRMERPAQEYLALQVARYEALLGAVWDDALDGDIKAHGAALDTLRDESKLLNLGGASDRNDNSDVAQFMAFIMGEYAEANSDDITDEDY